MPGVNGIDWGVTMTIKKHLLLATVLTVPFSGAMADDNAAYLTQTGPGNTAMVDQSGGDRNQAGRVGLELRQIAGQGAETANTLSIIQSGNDNSVGLGVGGNYNSQTGLRQNSQKGNGSTASVVQSSDDNVVGSLAQRTGYGPAPYDSGNAITVDQGGGDGNVIVRIFQDRQGANRGNTADIDMIGTSNYVYGVRQETNGSNTSGNQLTLNLQGDRNGLGGFDAAKAAALSGAGASEVQQKGADNLVSYTVLNGNDNQFGFDQSGSRNLADNILVTGDGNELGVVQSGSDNKLLIATVAGDENVVGLNQAGAGNTAKLDIDGSQNGGYFGFDGGSNAGSLMLAAGLVSQTGVGNYADLTVIGNGNVFAVSQDTLGGVSGNTVTGTQDNSGGGAGNQVAVLQAGQSNVAAFSQVGAGNNAAIQQ